MKLCLLFATAVASTAVFLGCGGTGETATSADVDGGDRTGSEDTQAQKEPRYPVPSAPPIKRPLAKLAVKDLQVGEGPVARWGDEAIVRYVGSYSKTGEVFTQHWGFTYSFELDGETLGRGWQKGIHGMRVGGRRELLIPGALLFGGGTDAAYVVSLVGVKPGATD